LLVVLNRGGSATLDVDYDEVLLGHADLTEGTLSIPASSISIIGHGGVVNENLTIEEESDELVSGGGGWRR
jgi:hypothetical protein